MNNRVMISNIEIQTCNGANVALFSHNTPFSIDKMKMSFKNSLANSKYLCIQIK